MSGRRALLWVMDWMTEKASATAVDRPAREGAVCLCVSVCAFAHGLPISTESCIPLQMSHESLARHRSRCYAGAGASTASEGPPPPPPPP
eukprot:SAG22_NODE_15593_length_345_cov_0.711382_1_plen_89_part_01